jgi:26S proteasome regulatory subunit RPN6 N-terminal domain
MFVPVRTLLDYFAAIAESKPTQIKVLQDNIDWAKREKRIFLKHSLETRLISLCVFSRLSHTPYVIVSIGNLKPANSNLH